MVRYDVQRNPDVIYQPSYFQQSFTGSYLREITSPPRVPEGCVFLDIKCAGPNDVRSHGIDDGCGVAGVLPVSYTHLRAHETDSYLVCRLLLEKKKNSKTYELELA